MRKNITGRAVLFGAGDLNAEWEIYKFLRERAEYFLMYVIFIMSEGARI